MAEIERRISGLVKAMKDLSVQGELSEADLKRFTQILEAIGGQSGQFAPKIAKIASAIQEMSNALAGMGASESYINRLKTTLTSLAVSYEHTAIASQKLQQFQAVPSVGGPTTLVGMGRFRAEQEIQGKYLGEALRGKTYTGNEEEIRSQIAGMASALRAADELTNKMLAQEIVERQITLEKQKQEAAIQQLIQATREQAAAELQLRDAGLQKFSQQPGLGAWYGRSLEPGFKPPEPPVQEPGTRQLFDPAEVQAEKDVQAELATNLRLQEAIIESEKRATSETQKQADAVRQLIVVTREQAALEQQRQYDLSAKGMYSAQISAARESGAIKYAGYDPEQAKRDKLELKAQSEETNVLSRGAILEKFAPQIPGGATGIENLNAKLKQFGVEAATVTHVTQEMSNGITSMSLSMDKGNGVMARGTVHMDRFGNVLQDTSRRFKSFADSVGTNIIKVTQWAVATGLVYGVVRQLGQVYKEIIDIQSKLASVQIALGVGQGDLNQVFSEALTIANLTSSTVAGVVESYALAYRATGQYSDEGERLIVTNKLLQESMILAKLAGLDQATAIDTLLGALRQTGLELDEGRDLLDKWVFVSRQANVSLNTLAQTYSIVGATAAGVGIEIEELNALAATLAESTGLSATETGNALRGIIAGFQSDTSEQTLARFGIATKTASGDLRDFMDLYNELARLSQSGILTEKDITEISNAIGGGYRRGAQVQVLLKNNESVARLTAAQFGAGGAAAEALGIELATLESALTRLGNAFTKFAQSLGQEGGFLTAITHIIDGMTGFLDIITSLVSGLGKATPALTAFGAAWLVLGSSKGQAVFKDLLNLSVGDKLAGAFGKVGIGPGTAEQQLIQSRYSSAAYGQGPIAAQQQNLTVAGAGQGIRGGIGGKIGIDPLALIAPILIAGSAVKKGIKEENPLEFGRAATSVVGAIIGGIVTAGNPLGIAAGSAMASSFYQGIVQYDDDLSSWWAEIYAKGRKKADEKPDEKAPEVFAQDQLNLVTRTGAGVMAGILQVYQTIVGKQPGQETADASGFITGFAREKAGQDVVNKSLGGLGFKIFARLFMSDEDSKAVLDQLQELIDTEDIHLDIADDMENEITKLKPIVGPIIDNFFKEQERDLSLGKISIPDFTRLFSVIDNTKIPLQLAKISKAADFADMSLDTEKFTKFLLELDEATRTYLTTLSDEVVSNYIAWQEALVDTTKSIEEQQAALDKYNDSVQAFNTLEPALELRHRIETTERPQVFSAGRATPGQVQTAVSFAQQLTRNQFMAQAKGDKTVVDAWIGELEPFIIKYGEEYGTTFGGTFAGTTQEALNEAFATFGWDDLLGEPPDFTFQDLRGQIGSEDLPDLMKRYQKIVGTVQTQFPNYKINEVDTGLITNDKLETIHVDMTLFNLAMQDLIDVNEQQLEGVWNIPSGMTAFIAWSSAMSRDVGGGKTSLADNQGPFTEDRQPVAPDVGSIEALQLQLTQITAFIMDMEKIVAMGPKEVGMQEYQAAQYDIREAEKEKASILEKLALTQLGTNLGITQQGDISIADQLREALSIQNKIELNASIRLVVDGRTLANVVKQYLFEDIKAASEKVGGSGSGSYVHGR